MTCTEGAPPPTAPPDRTALARPRVPAPLGSRARGRVAGCQFPARSPRSCRQNPESGFRAGDAEAAGRGSSRACRFSQSTRRCFFLLRVPRDLPKAGASGWRLLATHDRARVAQPPAASVKFRPSRHLRPPVTRATAAAPPPRGRAGPG